MVIEEIKKIESSPKKLREFGLVVGGNSVCLRHSPLVARPGNLSLFFYSRYLAGGYGSCFTFRAETASKRMDGARDLDGLGHDARSFVRSLLPRNHTDRFDFASHGKRSP